MAPPSARRADPGGLAARIVSALVLAPLALVALWFGGPWLTLLVAAAAGVMAWEWGRLIGSIGAPTDAAVFSGIAVLAVAAGGFAAWWIGVLVGAALILLRMTLQPRRDPRPLWAAGGLGWIVLPCLGLIWLRQGPGGLGTTLWVTALVWAVDIGAFAAGRSLGGPRLAPRISPKKTWSGLLGGVACAALVGAVAGGFAARPGTLVPLALLSGGLAIVEQIGDIAESYAKRRFGVKDSSSLIPGHGGLLDRLDGMLAVVVAVVLISLARGGSVVTWQ